MKNVTCYPYAIGGRKKERRKHDTFELFQRELFLRTSSVKRSEERGRGERERRRTFVASFPRSLSSPPLNLSEFWSRQGEEEEDDKSINKSTKKSNPLPFPKEKIPNRFLSKNFIHSSSSEKFFFFFFLLLLAINRIYRGEIYSFSNKFQSQILTSIYLEFQNF